jgi:Tfp pilus assembly protein PilF
VTTSSLAALRAYSQGLEAFYARGDRPRAAERLERAIAMDTGFAMAYRTLGILFGNVSESGRAMDAISRAYAHRDRLPLRERYLTVATYHANVTHDVAAAAHAYRDLLDLYPDDVRALNNLGIIERARHDFAAADTLLHRALAADSTIPSVLVELEQAQLLSGHYDSARTTIELLRRRFPTYRQLDLVEAYYASARRDWAGAERQLRARLAAVQGDTIDVIDALQSLGQIALAQGRRREGERALDSSLELSHALPTTPRAYAAAIALANADVAYGGAPDRGAQRVERELARLPLERASPGDRMYYDFARLFARAGRPARARALVAAAERDSAVRARHLDAERHAALGAIALAERRPADAQRELRQAEALDECTVCELPWLAASYELAGDTARAIVTYERYLATPWLFSFETDASWLAPSLVRLARLYELAGQREKAAAIRAELAKLLAGADAEVKEAALGTRLSARGPGVNRGGRGGAEPLPGKS